FVSGCLFLLLSLGGVRESIVKALSPSMRAGIAAGIGIFIAFIGLKNAGIVIGSEHQSHLVLNAKGLLSVKAQVFCFGLLMTSFFYVRRIRGAILWGILLAAVYAWFRGAITAPSGNWVGLPDVQNPAAFQMDLSFLTDVGKGLWVCLPYAAIFLFMDLFDTTGTLVAVAEQAEIMEDGQLPRARAAFTADAVGTVAGACLGTSTVTSYIESAAGVEEGGRTGLTAVTVAALFLLALFFSPIIAMMGAEPAITASALVLVGSMMARNTGNINWTDPTESVPAFLIMIGIPLTSSIGDGLALGFICYPLLKTFAGRPKEASWLSHGLAVTLIL
ncbi:MAG: NCS2 family permease, partial [Planctomycetales bacterium]